MIEKKEEKSRGEGGIETKKSILRLECQLCILSSRGFEMHAKARENRDVIAMCANLGEKGPKPSVQEAKSLHTLREPTKKKKQEATRLCPRFFFVDSFFWCALVWINITERLVSTAYLAAGAHLRGCSLHGYKEFRKNGTGVGKRRGTADRSKNKETKFCDARKESESD